MFPGIHFGTEHTGRIRSQSFRSFQWEKTDTNRQIVSISAIKEVKKKKEKEEERRGRRLGEGRRGRGRGGKKKTAEKAGEYTIVKST